MVVPKKTAFSFIHIMMIAPITRGLFLIPKLLQKRYHSSFKGLHSIDIIHSSINIDIRDIFQRILMENILDRRKPEDIIFSYYDKYTPSTEIVE